MEEPATSPKKTIKHNNVPLFPLSPSPYPSTMGKQVILSEPSHGEKEWREGVLTLTKSHVQSLGKMVSYLFIDFVFQMCEWDDVEIGNLFRYLRVSLEPIIGAGPHNGVVVDRVFALLRTGERGLRNRDESVRLKEKGPERSERIDAGLVTQRMKFAYLNVHRFRDLILCLEDLVSLPLRSVVTFDQISGHAQYVQMLGGNLLMEMSQICESPISSGFDSEKSEDFEQVDQDPLKELMQSAVEELWRDFELCQQ